MCPEAGGVFVVAESTDIWLDRSGERRPNLVGSFTGCEVGHTVEVRFGSGNQAHWVKVRLD